MIFLALLLKPVVWFVAFRSGTSGNRNTMLLWAAGITVILTLVDKVCIASNLAVQAILLTFVLYGVMSFILFPLAWKVKKATLSVVLNMAGVIGAFAGVNFTMDFLRAFLPIMNR
jgi:hypothetical protein